MKVLLNNKIKESKKLDIDTGYYYGYGVFETILVREGIPILLKQHLDRLHKGLEKLSIHKTILKEEVLYAISALRIFNGALKVNVSEKNILYSTRKLNYTAQHYQMGMNLAVSEVLRNPTSLLVSIKSMNYMDNILEMKRAKEKECHDAVFLNYDGEVCETCTANIFIIENQKIITPPESCGLLAGVVRGWVCEHYEVIKEPFDLKRLLAADGVFLTNSLMGIMKVSEINNHKIAQSDRVKEITIDYVHFLKEEGDLI